MDREILFRGKRLDNGEWVQGYYVKLYSNGGSEPCYMIFTIDEEKKEGQPYLIDPKTVCQYTGLTDKNGRKTFEGDILKVIFREARVRAVEKDYMYTVIFCQSEASFELEGNDDLLGKPCLCESNQHIYEVVGNIFDNPFLLEGGEV